MSKARGLFKDCDSINRKTEQEDNLNRLAQAVEKNTLDEFLFSGQQPDSKEYHPNHNGCTYKNEPNKDVEDIATTEKRMCRCMYYCNGSTDEQKKYCENSCTYPWKWFHDATDGFEIIDYEVPMTYVSGGIGGVDLILKDIEGSLYTVEVKPESSTETIVRMIAEALTYNRDAKFFGKYRPAICFFVGSSQEKQMQELAGNHDLQNILKNESVAVFTISYLQENGKNFFRFH